MTPRTARGLARTAGTGALLVALAAAATGCGGSDGAATPGSSAAPPSTTRPAPTHLEVDFEDGGLGGVSDHDRARVVGEAARTGELGLEIDAATSGAYVRWVPPTGHRFWSLRGFVRVVAWTDRESVDLFTVQNSRTTNNFDLFVTAPARAFQWDLFREDDGRTAAPVELGRWYLVEAHGEFGADASAAEVRIDGVPQPAIRSSGQPPATVQDFVLGSIATAKTKRAQFDDVRFEVADAPLGFPGPPAP